MTLNTSFRIIEPTDAFEAFQFARTIIGAENGVYSTHKDHDWATRPAYYNRIGQGFVAIVDCEYGADGPISDPQDEEDYHRGPDAAIELSFDTAYGYRAENGAGCSDLHAWIIEQLVAWCDERGLSWAWQNEFTGEWHTDLTEPLGRASVGEPSERDKTPGGLVASPL